MDGVDKVRGFGLSQLADDAVLQAFVQSRRRAVVYFNYYEAFIRQKLVVEKIELPRVRHLWRGRSAINAQNHRITMIGPKTFRLQNLRGHRKSVRCRNGQHLRILHVETGKQIHSRLCKRDSPRAFSSVKPE